MKSEEEFDDFIKSKFSDENNFPFEEDKWARMEEMIIKDELKRRRRRYAAFYLGGFISALLILLPFYFMREADKFIEKNKQKTTYQSRNTGNSFLKEHGTKEETTTKADKQLISEQESSSAMQIPPHDRITKTDQNNIQSSNLKFPAIPEKQYTTLENKTDKLATNLFQKSSEDHQQIGVQNNKNITNDTFLISNNMIANDSVNLVEAEILIDSLLPQKQLNDTLMLEGKDNISSNQRPIAKDPVAKLIKKHSLEANLGVAYNLGYDASEGRSFSPYVALKYGFNSKLFIGLGYFQVNKLTTGKEFIQTSYDFGYREKVSTVTQKSLHFICIPIEYHHSFGKNTAGIGVSPAFLVLNQSEVQVKNRTAFSETIENSEKSYRYAYGLSSFDLLLSLTYIRQITPKLAMGAAFNYGLTDIRKDDWTNVKKRENNKFLTLMLLYKLK